MNENETLPVLRESEKTDGQRFLWFPSSTIEQGAIYDGPSEHHDFLSSSPHNITAGHSITDHVLLPDSHRLALIEAGVDISDLTSENQLMEECRHDFLVETGTEQEQNEFCPFYETNELIETALTSASDFMQHGNSGMVALMSITDRSPVGSDSGQDNHNTRTRRIISQPINKLTRKRKTGKSTPLKKQQKKLGNDADDSQVYKARKWRLDEKESFHGPMTDNSSQFDDESADESVTIVTSETESEEESVKNRLSRTSRYRHRRRNTTKHGMDTTTLGKEERQQLNKDDRSHPTKQERKQFPSAHSGGEWNSHFCYICGTRGEVVCCDTCPASYHVLCLAKNPELAQYITSSLLSSAQISSHNGASSLGEDDVKHKTCKLEPCEIPKGSDHSTTKENAQFSTDRKDDSGNWIEFKTEVKNNENETSSAPWNCPKCHYVCFEEAKIHSGGAVKKNKFNFQRWLSTTVAPDDVSLDAEAPDVLNLLLKYGESTPTKSGAKRSKTTSDERQIYMSQLNDKDFRSCMRKLCDDSLRRSASFLETFLGSCSSSKNEKDLQNFLDYGSGVSWLLSNLLDFLDSALNATLHARFAAIGRATLSKWATQFHQRLKHRTHSDVSTLALCLIEATEAEKTLWTEKTSTFREYLDEFLEKGGLEEFLEVDLTKMIDYETACPNCHTRFTTKSTICSECDFRSLYPVKAIQFRKLTNALVWRSLFSSAGVDVGINSQYSLEDILSATRRCRPWRSFYEIGFGDFKLQLYLITHIIFILSDWGQCRLLPDDLPEEYLFLRSSLRLMISFDDCELVGEILQCLSIFGEGHGQTRTWTQSSIEYGIAYLLEREKRFGRQGRFLSQSESFYDRIHTTYCAMLGLLSLHPTERKEQNNGEKLHLMKLFKQPHPEGPIYLPNEIPRSPISLDLLLRSSSLQQESAPNVYRSPLEMYLKQEKKVLLTRPASAIRELQKHAVEARVGPEISSSPLADVPLKDVNGIKGKGEKELCQLRVGVIGTEWAVLAHDLAVVLRMERRLFCRLISRITPTPPVVTPVLPSSTSSWKPSIPKTKKVCDRLSLAPIYEEASLLEERATRDNKEQSRKKEVALEQTRHGCWLGGSLLTISDKETRIGVALSRHHLVLLLEAVEQSLYEEALFVDTQSLKSFIQTAFKTDESIRTVPLRVAQAFPELCHQTGENFPKVMSKQVKKGYLPEAKLTMKSKKNLSRRSLERKRRHGDEDNDLNGLTGNWETEFEKTSLTWSGQRRNQRRKLRMEQRDKQHGEGNQEIISGREYEKPITTDTSFDPNIKPSKNQTLDVPREELIVLPKDRLQSLIDDLLANAELLYDRACHLP